MTKSTMKANSAKKIRAAVILLLITSFFSYFGNTLFAGKDTIVVLSQIFQYLMIIVSPIMIYKSLSLEIKWASRFERKFIKATSLLKILLIAVIVSSIIVLSVNLLTEKLPILASISLIRALLSIVAVFFSYYSFITVFALYYAVSEKTNKKVHLLSRISFILGIVLICLKLYGAVCNVTHFQVNPLLSNTGTIIGIISIVHYLLFIVLLTIAEDYYLRTADIETDTYRNPRLEKNRDKIKKGSYLIDKQKLYGIDEDEYCPESTDDSEIDENTLTSH